MPGLMVLGEVAQLIGLLPLTWLVAMRVSWVRVDAAYWWMAVAFGVSFIADFVPHPIGHQVYPVAQAALFALVLLPRPSALLVLAVLAVVASASIGWRGGSGLDVALRVVAWGTVAGLAWQIPRGPLRYVLSVGFTAMTLGWLAYVVAPGWASWLTLQGARLGTALAWCGVAWKARESYAR